MSGMHTRTLRIRTEYVTLNTLKILVEIARDFYPRKMMAKVQVVIWSGSIMN